VKNISKSERRRQAARITKLKRELHDAQYKRWVIRFSWKHGYPKGDPQKWQSWRSFATVGKLFKSKEEAEDYFNNHSFKNMSHLRKLSACIGTVSIKKG
jgi:hypothetical protein